MNINEIQTFESFSDFIHANQGKAFRYWIYRKMYTPREVDGKYKDESFYEDPYCKIAYITECVNLPDGDILIGFLDAEMAGDCKCFNNIQYCKLSEIRMEMYEGDLREDE